jgi:hypothetical protein
VQEEILEKNPAADIQVYAVWFNMFPGDDRSGWDFSLLSDPRVRHFWDEDKLAGRFFAQSEDFYLPVAWDIYYLYGPDAHWDELLRGVVPYTNSYTSKSLSDFSVLYQKPITISIYETLIIIWVLIQTGTLLPCSA